MTDIKSFIDFNNEEIVDFISPNGLLANAIPSVYGGKHGSDFNTLLDDHIALGKMLYKEENPMGSLLSLNAHLWGGIFCLNMCGTEAQKNKYLKKAVNCEIFFGHAITEKGIGSDINDMGSNYRKSDEGFIINAKKYYITNTTTSTHIIVYCKNVDTNNITPFIIDSNKIIKKNISLDIFKGCSIGEIFIEDLFVTKDSVVGENTEIFGLSIFNKVIELERSFIFAGMLGLIKKLINETVKYTKNNNAYKFNSVSTRLAQAKKNVTLVELLLKNISSMKDNSKNITQESSIAKVTCSDLLYKTVLLLIESIGSEAFSSDFGLSQIASDVLSTKILSGTNDIQNNIISSFGIDGDA